MKSGFHEKSCAGLFFALAATIAWADNENEIARCARISSLSERILCLEDALRHPESADDTAPTDDLAVAAGPVAEPSVAAPSPEPSDGEMRHFGMSEAAMRPALPAAFDVVVVAINNSAYGKLIYVTASGQTWRQTDKGKPRYGPLPFRARIRKAAAGSFFITPVSGGIAVRVRRKD